MIQNLADLPQPCRENVGVEKMLIDVHAPSVTLYKCIETYYEDGMDSHSEFRWEQYGMAMSDYLPDIPAPFRQSRPTWHAYFMGIAEAVAARASCPRATCGAVVVDGRNRIVSTGYNGAPPGEPDCLEVGCDMEGDHCQRALHAEVNAVAHAARSGASVAGCRVYIYRVNSGSVGEGPCRECLKVLTAAGVSVANEY